MSQRALLALALLYSRKDMPMSELAAECECTPANMTGLVDTLDVAGLAARDAMVKGDRRKVTVRLTEQGVAMVEALAAKMEFEMGSEPEPKEGLSA
jgi:DNA-binding MarR family transcriptional regulator